MLRPTIPLDESQRLERLRSLHLLDTPAEERFDRLTRIAQTLLDVPVAAITLVDASRQWFKSSQGIALTQFARDVSFCAHAILGSELLVVDDLRADSRFADNPFVTSSPYFRFYAGHPLSTIDGSVVGTLAVFDYRPRTLKENERSAMSDLAAVAEKELRTSPFSPAQIDMLTDDRKESQRIDPLTRLWNRAAVIEILERELSFAEREGSSLGVMLADIDHLQRINQTRGHEAGDSVLCDVARRMRASLRPYDSVGRFGGEEFLVLLPSADSDTAYAAAERIRAAIATDEAAAATISIGVAAREPRSDAASLIRAAERALQQAKIGGGNRVQIAQE
jgi:diguanylate cyclase (GGDEF)-like protein